MTCGVRQVGVLSPLLFAVFVDKLFTKLEDSTYGGFIKELCYNAIMYADDIILLAISICDLQAMLNICLTFFDDLDIEINAKKSNCMRVGPQHKITSAEINVKNVILDWKAEIKFLGVNLTCGNHLGINLQSARQKYFQAANGIFAKIGTLSSPAVLISLVDSFCVRILCYGMESFNLSKTNYNKLDAAQSAIFFKVFSCSDKQNVCWCQYYMNVLPLSYCIDNRRLKFLNRLNNIKNDSVKCLYDMTCQREHDTLLLKYNVPKNCQNPKNILFEHFRLNI